MAVRTVTVNLRLNAANYLRDGRLVNNLNRDIARSFRRIDRDATLAANATRAMARANNTLRRSAQRAQDQIADLRREINRLRRAMSRVGPINILGGGRGGGGGGIWNGLMQAFMRLPAPVQAAIGTAIGGAIAASATFIGSALASVLVTALGAGGLAAGIVSAAKDTDVRNAFGEFGDFVAEEFRSYGGAFEVPLIAVADRFKDRWASVSPEIRSMLADLSVVVEPLGRGMSGFVEKMLPGLRAGLEGAVPLLDILARELPSIGEAIGWMFGILGRNSHALAMGFKALLIGLQAFIKIGTYGLLFLASSFMALIMSVSGLVGALNSLPDALKSTLFTPMGAAALDNVDNALKRFTEDARHAGTGLEDMGYKADNARDALERLTEAMTAQATGVLDMRAATRAYEESLDALVESVKENGRSLDDNTEKGRANNAAIDQAIQNAYALREAMIQNGATTAQANAAFNSMIERIRALATQMGLSKAQVDALIRSLGALPTGEKQLTYTVKTQYVEYGTRPARVPPGTRQFQRYGGITYAREGLMSLSGQAGIASGGRPLIGFAEPGTGGEAFIARNAPQSRSLAIANQAAGWHGGMVVPKGAGASINVTVNAGWGTDGAAVAKQVMTVLRREIKDRGGNVQKVLGRSG